MIFVILLATFISGTRSGEFVVAAGEDSGLPEGCEPAQVRAIFEDFTQAVDSERKGVALGFIAAPPEQNGFSVGSPESRGNLLLSKNPKAIYAFFAREAKNGQRLRLLGGDVKPLDPGAIESGPYGRPDEGPVADDPVSAVAFELKMSRPGSPLRQPSGKAGINCASGQFYVWALDFGPPIDKRYDGVRVCANKPRVTATKPFKNPVMC